MFRLTRLTLPLWRQSSASIPVMARTALHRNYSAAKPFEKVLIANRGEIACRVMDTCDRLGIDTVAVYSEADAGAKHVQKATEAVCIGPPPTADSYLRIDRIIEACKTTGANAVHPGYGFLSENDEFTEALATEGIKFIGPRPHAMKVMGDKIESKKLAEGAGVNVIPGWIGEVKTDEDVLRIANEIGYPVMIKASAGGGGKGMRVAWNDKEALEGFRLSRSEAASSFGDDRMLIEKFIDSPRHIEFQILADSHDNCVYLFERECSLQRRNQKVIEEAPSPFLDDELRRQMGEQAVALARAVQYESAGTVEMLVNATDRSFYFLEMNTRLQVEHPVTEYITGVDIVEQMINVAAGRPLPFKQDDLRLQGWAVESRVYAEDPTRNFMPSIGRLTGYEEPETSEHVRCDSGVVKGSEISMFYDPMICKLICGGKTRQEAISASIAALDEYVIRGVKHNVGFLRELLEHPKFIAGDMTTNFIAEEYPKGFKGRVPRPEEKKEIALITAMMRLMQQIPSRGPTQHLDEPIVVRVDDYEATINGMYQQNEEIGVLYVWEDGEDEPGNVMIRNIEWPVNGPLFRAQIGEEPVQAQYVGDTYKSIVVEYKGQEYNVECAGIAQSQLQSIVPEDSGADMSNSVISPMPGKVLKVAVQPGDKVVVGQEVAVVEAMKMQNVIRAERDAVVGSVHVEEGDEVAVDEELVTFEAK